MVHFSLRLELGGEAGSGDLLHLGLLVLLVVHGRVRGGCDLKSFND